MGLGMSAFKGEADGDQRPSELPLIAEAVEKLFGEVRGARLIRRHVHWRNRDCTGGAADSIIARSLPPCEFFNSLSHKRTYSHEGRKSETLPEPLNCGKWGRRLVEKSLG